MWMFCTRFAWLLGQLRFYNDDSFSRMARLDDTKISFEANVSTFRRKPLSSVLAKFEFATERKVKECLLRRRRRVVVSQRKPSSIWRMANYRKFAHCKTTHVKRWLRSPSIKSAQCSKVTDQVVYQCLVESTRHFCGKASKPSSMTSSWQKMTVSESSR